MKQKVITTCYKLINANYICILLLMLVSISSVNAQKAGGAPKQEELIGYWKMEKWPTPDVIKVNPWPQPYQWFAFYEDGRMLSMMNSTDGNYTSSDLEEIFSSLPKQKSPKYELKGLFLIVENPNIKDYQEMWGMNLFNRDVGDVLKKGDLVMSLAGSDGAPVYYRLLRRVK